MGIVMVAILVTTIKIILFDKETYPSLFYTKEEINAMKNVSGIKGYLKIDSIRF